MRKVSQSYLKEFANEDSLLKQINNKYRMETKTIFSFMNPEIDIINEIAPAVEIFKTRSRNFIPLGEQARKLKADEPGGFDGLVYRVYTHVMDRLMRSDLRKQELVTYKLSLPLL